MRARFPGSLVEAGAMNVVPEAGAANAILSTTAVAGARGRLRRVRVVAEDAQDLSVIEREFSTVIAECSGPPSGGDVVIDDIAWRGAFELARFDEMVEHALSRTSDAVLAVRGDDAAAVACQVVTRYQRFVARRNVASTAPLFDAALEAHAAMHDYLDAQARVRFETGLDTWQWILRLDPHASLAAQLAAVVHGTACADDASEDRLDHRASGHPITDAVRVRGGQRAFDIVRRLGASDADASKVREIIRRCDGSAEGHLLDDADALSFLSLRSSRYADHFGVAQTRRKLAHTISRLGPAARAKLSFIRLRPDVERLVQASAS